MTDTTVATANEVKQWDAKFFIEYVRDNRFKRYMGTDTNSVFQLQEDLTKKAGDAITVSLVTRLIGGGVTGNTALEDAEEALGNYGHQISVDTRRNGVVVTDNEQQATAIQLRDAARPQLKQWCMEKTRDDIITALGSINGTAFGSATEAAKDAWQTDNSDRVVYGNAVANATGDSSLDLAKVDGTNDTLTAPSVSLMKRIAKTADPHIRPIITMEDEEWFVMFTGSLTFRDLKNDTTMATANREAWTRGKGNPLFRDGDLIYDGVIIREVPEIAVIAGVGAAAINVGPAYLCGAQAVGVAYAQRPKSTIDERDYQFRHGVGIQEMIGIEKLLFKTATTNPADHGVVTGFFAAVADA